MFKDPGSPIDQLCDLGELINCSEETKISIMQSLMTQSVIQGHGSLLEL